MDEINILPHYRGNLMHDGWWSYDGYTKCRHSLCCVHLLRELTFFAELSAEQKSWAMPLKDGVYRNGSGGRPERTNANCDVRHCDFIDSSGARYVI
jgi:hypothetical protein